MTSRTSHSGYLPINGLNLHYEVYGGLDAQKPPLQLIPGAFMGTDSGESGVLAPVVSAFLDGLAPPAPDLF
ncbi:hypothetical protein ACWDTP_00855 [Mycobacterium sp. NPDC003449]